MEIIENRRHNVLHYILEVWSSDEKENPVFQDHHFPIETIKHEDGTRESILAIFAQNLNTEKTDSDEFTLKYTYLCFCVGLLMEDIIRELFI